ncbi:MAG: hypothetical protein WA117_02730 [Verrucomicrobiia bacterium]
MITRKTSSWQQKRMKSCVALRKPQVIISRLANNTKNVGSEHRKRRPNKNIAAQAPPCRASIENSEFLELATRQSQGFDPVSPTERSSLQKWSSTPRISSVTCRCHRCRGQSNENSGLATLPSLPPAC